MKIFFVLFFCVFLPPLLSIFCFFYVHTVSVFYCAHVCMKCSLGISNSLEEISSLSHSIVFLYFFALITEEGFLISPCYSLELCIQMGLSFLFSFAFASPLFLAICKATSDNHLTFCIFPPLGMVLITVSPVQCYKPLSIVFQALCLSDLISWICLSLPLYSCKGFDLSHIWMDVRIGLWRKLSAEELLNCGAGEDSWESLRLQGNPISPC